MLVDDFSNLSYGIDDAGCGFTMDHRHLGDPSGQVFVFFILTVAAAESAIGLAILVTLFRSRRSINVDDLDSMKG